MISDKQDKLIRGYAKLISFKENLPKGHYIHEKYVEEYNSTLVDLQRTTGTDLSEFIIPQREIQPVIGSYNGMTGETNYTEERFCERDLLLIKLDAVLSYFTITDLAKDKPPIGFKIDKGKGEVI